MLKSLLNRIFCGLSVFLICFSVLFYSVSSVKSYADDGHWLLVWNGDENGSYVRCPSTNLNDAFEFYFNKYFTDNFTNYNPTSSIMSVFDTYGFTGIFESWNANTPSFYPNAYVYYEEDYNDYPLCVVIDFYSDDLYVNPSDVEVVSNSFSYIPSESGSFLYNSYYFQTSGWYQFVCSPLISYNSSGFTVGFDSSVSRVGLSDTFYTSLNFSSPSYSIGTYPTSNYSDTDFYNNNDFSYVLDSSKPSAYNKFYYLIDGDYHHLSLYIPLNVSSSAMGTVFTSPVLSSFPYCFISHTGDSNPALIHLDNLFTFTYTYSNSYSYLYGTLDWVGDHKYYRVGLQYYTQYTDNPLALVHTKFLSYVMTPTPTPTPIPTYNPVTPTPFPTAQLTATMTPIPNYTDVHMDVDSGEVVGGLSGYTDILNDFISTFSVFPLAGLLIDYMYSFSPYFSFLLVVPVIALIAYIIGRLNQK